MTERDRLQYGRRNGSAVPAWQILLPRIPGVGTTELALCAGSGIWSPLIGV